MTGAPWLTIIGIGEDGREGLSSEALRHLDGAEIVYGGKRHLELAGDVPGEKCPWKTPLLDSIADLEKLAGKPVVVLGTGDPMWFGIGNTLLRYFDAADIRMLSFPSAFSLAAARLGWPLQDIKTLSVHGRPVEAVLPHLAPGQRLLLLCQDGRSPAALSEMLSRQGYGSSEVIALSHIGGPEEVIHRGHAAGWAEGNLPSLTTVAIECVLDGSAIPRSRAPGLPDEAFDHDGNITKREVRAATLAALMPLPGAVLWDVGAGCGAVAIEWCRASDRASAHAIESRIDRISFIEKNMQSLGTAELNIIHGEAPAAYADLPDPDAVFIGGGVTGAGVVDQAWSRLRSGGRMVVNTVTLEGEVCLQQSAKRYGGELLRIAVSRGGVLGDFTAMRPLMPIAQWRAIKS